MDAFIVDGIRTPIGSFGGSLSPVRADDLAALVLRELRNRGVSVLLIEQKLTIAMQISDRALVMGHGSMVFDGTPDSLRANAAIRKEWLEV